MRMCWLAEPNDIQEDGRKVSPRADAPAGISCILYSTGNSMAKTDPFPFAFGPDAGRKATNILSEIYVRARVFCFVGQG